MVTITHPDGHVESFHATSADMMLVCLSEWEWIPGDDVVEVRTWSP